MKSNQFTKYESDFLKYLLGSLDYSQYIKEFKIDKLFNINTASPKKILEKRKSGIYESVDPNNTTAFAPELDDLTRLHFLATSRKATTILEFGVGYSTVVFMDAIKRNKLAYSDYVKNNLRCSNPFEVHSIDNNKSWIDTSKKRLSKQNLKVVHFHLCKLIVSSFNYRICTYYKNLPNISPDIIYLDGPDQFSAEGSLRGISTNHPDRMPMAADILVFEHLLAPGTLIIVDGRTSNARFLKCNLQRNWRYVHAYDYDVHFFELHERPLGKLNHKKILFSLPKKFLSDLK